jgi:hypothetical protein
MQAIAVVYQALCVAETPTSRADLQSLTGLDRETVKSGLRGLARRSLLAIELREDGVPLYAVRSRSEKIEDLRMRKSRMHRALLRDAMLEYHASPHYSPARPPSHSHTAGMPKPPDISLRALICKLIRR